MLWEETESKSYSDYLVVWGADIIFSLEIKYWALNNLE